MNRNEVEGTDNAGVDRRVVPVTFVDVWIRSPVIVTFGVVALTLIGAVPLVLLKSVLAMSSLLPAQDPILAFAVLLSVFAALLGWLWLGCRLALRLFNAATMMTLLYWKGLDLTDSAEVVYRGYANDNAAGGRLVMIEIGGETYPLPHQAKHSPTGMSWGYHGSGPADLARSLLIHALGDDARCPVCEGTAEVVYDVAADAEVPARSAISHPDDTANGQYSEVMGCYHCEDGSVVMPSLYQPFKRDVIANLPESGWALTRTEVLDWIQQHPPTKK